MKKLILSALAIATLGTATISPVQAAKHPSQTIEVVNIYHREHGHYIFKETAIVEKGENIKKAVGVKSVTTKGRYYLQPRIVKADNAKSTVKWLSNDSYINVK